ncbi:hypothetical protein LOK49_LG03G01215 [Camellia lanceoleosa]|uniref:Uncharacterized protein n=1 Tax=Camellia lanceoleosa TaxID=1840588 RepID=A0ACC0I8P8_9ERIC|nr:hypothetical protein LOK49_LG03G01215 [Camellia lanceoleosa]
MASSSHSTLNLESISLEDGTEAVEDVSHWCLVGKILSPKQLNKQAVSTIIHGAWKARAFFSISPWNDNMYLFTFDEEEDRKWVLQESLWSIMGSLMVLQPLVIGLPVSNIEFNRYPFWVQVHGLPLEKLTKANGEIIGKRVGRLIKVEALCEGLLLYRNFLRIRVDVDVTKPLPRGFILNQGGNAQMTSVDPWISFKYEKISDFCYDCGRIGHDRNVWPQSSPVPPVEARGNGARDGDTLRPTTVTEDNVSVRPNVGVVGPVMVRVETAGYQGQQLDIHEQQLPISRVETSSFPSVEGCSNLATAAVGPRTGVRNGPSGFGPNMQASPQYFVTEPVETIGPVTKESSFLSKAHSEGPLEIEEVSPATSPVRQDLKTRVIDECMSTVFNFLSLKRKAHECDLQDTSHPKLLKRDGLTTIPIETIEFPSTFTQLSSVVPIPGIKDKARKIVRRRRRSVDKGLFDMEVASDTSPDTEVASEDTLAEI